MRAAVEGSVVRVEATDGGGDGGGACAVLVVGGFLRMPLGLDGGGFAVAGFGGLDPETIVALDEAIIWRCEVAPYLVEVRVQDFDSLAWGVVPRCV